MYTVATTMRYCRTCHRATVVELDHASGSTVCSVCAVPLGERYVDVSSEWRDFACGADGDVDVGAAATDHFLAHDKLRGGGTVAYSVPAPLKVQAKASADADPLEGARVIPRMRGAVGDGGVMPRMRGMVGGGGGGGAGVAPRMRGAVGPNHDKALEASHAIDDMAERLALPAAVKDRAKDVLNKLEESKAFSKGIKCRSRSALYAACLHTACRAEGTPRTFKELASVAGDSANAGIKDIGRLAKHIKQHLAEEAGGPAANAGAVVRAGDYLRRFGSLLGIGDQEVLAAQKAAQRLEGGLDVRRNPDSIAAAVIYMAIMRAGAGKSMREVSTATGVSELTIRDVYNRDLYPHAELLFG